jgi:archaemetzincin
MGSGSYIYFQWIGTGQVEEAVLRELKTHIETVFGFPTKVIHSPERPAGAFDARRRQYSSTTILRWVLGRVPADAAKILAITDGDLFIPVLTFVFGEAQLGGKGAVVSTARLQVEFNGLPSRPHLFRARLLKECAHELGHTFGLAHCTVARCVMSRSNTVPEVDAKTDGFCRNCRRWLRDVQKEQGDNP